MAKTIGALQIGKANKHINESYGGDKNLMKFYVTEYSSKLGVEGFVPQIVEGHKKSGYTSNIRPGIYYSASQDNFENPNLGKLLKGNYESTTKKDFPVLQRNKESFRSDLSGGCFRNNEVNFSFKYSVNPITSGNKRNCFLTESRAQYTHRDPFFNNKGKTVGAKKEMSGHVRAKNVEPITFCAEKNSKKNESLAGTTMYTSSYRPWTSKGVRFSNLPNVERESGFTRYIKPTASHTAVKGEPAQIRIPDSFTAMPTANKNVNRKEQTGYTHNNAKSFLTDSIHSDIYRTNYAQEFKNKNRLPNNYFHDGSFKNGGVLALTGTGFTRNAITTIEKNDGRGNTSNLHPYVDRSLKARYPICSEYKCVRK